MFHTEREVSELDAIWLLSVVRSAYYLCQTKKSGRVNKKGKGVISSAPPLLISTNVLIKSQKEQGKRREKVRRKQRDRSI